MAEKPDEQVGHLLSVRLPPGNPNQPIPLPQCFWAGGKDRRRHVNADVVSVLLKDTAHPVWPVFAWVSPGARQWVWSILAWQCKCGFATSTFLLPRVGVGNAGVMTQWDEIFQGWVKWARAVKFQARIPAWVLASHLNQHFEPWNNAPHSYRSKRGFYHCDLYETTSLIIAILPSQVSRQGGATGRQSQGFTWSNIAIHQFYTLFFMYLLICITLFF